MIRLRSLAALAGLALAACSPAPPDSGGPVTGNDGPSTLAGAQQASAQRGVPILLDFWKHG